MTWATVAGTARPGVNYTPDSQTATIAAGAQTTTISVPILDYEHAEPTKQFTVQLSAPVNATIAQGTGVLTITEYRPRAPIDPTKPGHYFADANVAANATTYLIVANPQATSITARLTFTRRWGLGTVRNFTIPGNRRVGIHVQGEAALQGGDAVSAVVQTLTAGTAILAAAEPLQSLPTQRVPFTLTAAVQPPPVPVESFDEGLPELETDPTADDDSAPEGMDGSESVTPLSASGVVVEYYGLDAIGSVRVVFSATGAVQARADYTPFGAEHQSSGNLPAQRFIGQERDHEAAKDYFGARYYQTRHGRFGSVDPLFTGAVTNPQRWNRYTYALNSPLVFVDSDGLAPYACTGVGVNQGWEVVCGPTRDGGGGGGGGWDWRLPPSPPFGLPGGNTPGQFPRGRDRPDLGRGGGGGGGGGGGMGGDGGSGGEGTPPETPPPPESPEGPSGPDQPRCSPRSPDCVAVAWHPGQIPYYVPRAEAEEMYSAQMWLVATFGVVVSPQLTGSLGPRIVGGGRIKVDGPSAGFAHGQGRFLQLRVGSRVLARIDYHSRVPGGPSRWHLHLLPRSPGEHGLVIGRR